MLAEDIDGEGTSSPPSLPTSHPPNLLPNQKPWNHDAVVQAGVVYVCTITMLYAYMLLWSLDGMVVLRLS